MNRPGIVSYAIGNLFSCLVMLSFAGYLLFQAWDLYQHRDTISWLVGAIALMIGSSTIKANRRISDYNDWKRAWQGVSGEQQQASGRRGRRMSLVLFAVVIWVGTAYWLHVHSDERASSTYNNVLAAFGLVSVAGMVAGAGIVGLRLVLWIRRRAKAAVDKRAREHVVALCLPVPGESAKPNQITAALPSYCKPLLPNISSTLSGDRRA